MADPVDFTLLDRYLSGDCTPAERLAVDRQLATDPNWRVALDETRVIRAQTRHEPARVDDAEARAALRLVRDRLSLDQPVRRVSTVTPQQSSGSWSLLRAAAAVLIVAGGALALWQRPTQQFREFTSSPGSRTTITLRDGTRLVLGPASRLRVGADFGRADRVVELDGEALLTVVHDARHPFAVRTSHTTVRDVGTRFTVRAYADDDTEHVAVAEGEVQVGGVASLLANDAAAIDPSGHITVYHHADVARDIAWIQGDLTFKDTPLRDVARSLERTYDVHITVRDTTLAGRRVTGSFPNAPVDEVLDALTRVLGAQYERAGRTVTIEGHLAPAQSITSK